MAIYTEEQIEDGSALEDYRATRQAVAGRMFDTPLPNNPNTTWGDTISMPELLQVGHRGNSLLREKRAELFNDEQISTMENAIQNVLENRISIYNRPPRDYNVAEIHPEYAEALRLFENPREQTDPLAIINAMEGIGRFSDRPVAPFGLERAQELAAMGFDPTNQLKIDNFADRNLFRIRRSLSPRNSTIGDVEKAAEGVSGIGEGEYIYLRPNDPSYGIGFVREGQENVDVKNVELIDTPYLTDEDIYDFLLQEFPAAAGDIVLTAYGYQKFGTPLGLTGSVVAQSAKVLGMSGLSAVGAAGGDFLRLTAGKAMGAHDRTMDEILTETGMIAALAFAGTGTIDIAQRVLPKAWRLITGKDVPAEFWTAIDDAYVAARDPSNANIPGVVYGDPVSVQQIQSQIDELTDIYGVIFNQKGRPPGYNPLLSARSGHPDATELERIFLRNSDNPELKQLYNELKRGNQRVEQQFIETLREKVGPSISGIDDVTSAELSEGLLALGQKEVDNFTNQMEGMLDKVRTQVGGQGTDAAAAGNVLRDVVDEKASGELLPRAQSRIREIRNEYIRPHTEAWNAALRNPLYADTFTGAGFTRKPTQNWLNLRKGNADTIFRAQDADDAVRGLFSLIPRGAQNTLRRLRGIGEKGFESPNFSLVELNDARVALNDFASNLPKGQNATREAARDLERGLEQQMSQLVRESASEASGIPLTSKTKLDDWMTENAWGADIEAAWTSQKRAYELGNAQAIRSLLQQERPERVADYLFNTSATGSAINTPVDQLMTILKQEGSDEIQPLQEGLAAYIQRVVLDAPDSTPIQIARNFRNFVKEHEGVLKSVFGEEKYAQWFGGGPQRFQEEVINKLQRTEETIQLIKNRFGLAGNINDPGITNILENILTTSKESLQSGRILQDIENLMDIVKDSPELREQISQVTKRFIFQDIIKSRKGGGFELDVLGLDRLINEGFGPAEITGPKLTFENFMAPLLGDETAPEFLKNLEVLNGLVQRNMASDPLGAFSQGLGQDLATPLLGARFLQRMVIGPLTQMGRRATALTNKSAERARNFIGHMLLDEELFNRSIAFARNRVSKQNFIRYLTAHYSVAAQDMANELKYYDTEDKLQRPTEGTFEEFVGIVAETPQTIREIPQRVLELAMAEPD